MRFKVVYDRAAWVISTRLQVYTTASVLALVRVACECLSPKCFPMFRAVKRAICLCFYTTKITLQMYTYVFVDLRKLTFILMVMSQKICYPCEAVCNSISEECASCGTRLAAEVTSDFNPLPFIAAVCASFLMIGVIIGTTA